VNPGTTFESQTGALIDSALVILGGGTARFTATSTPSVSSIEGGGSLILGNTSGSGTIPLAVGQNNLTTTFGGVISQATGFTGSLTKVGTGVLTLTNGNTYSGGTRVNAGTLLINNTTGSGTGSGPVTATNGATFGGVGTAAGNTTGSLVNILSGGRLDPGRANGFTGAPDVGTLTSAMPARRRARGPTRRCC
jgi:autotransporter-associated beta strand protein